jgi:hypothetical protein
MNILKKIAGKILDAVSQLISIILDALIAIIEFAVILVNTIGRGLISFIGLGGCLIFFLLGPFGIFLLMNPIVLFSLLLFVIFPILGTKFVSYLKYVKYMLTEYLFDYASYLIHGKNKRFASFAEYGNKYRKAEEARMSFSKVLLMQLPGTMKFTVYLSIQILWYFSITKPLLKMQV